MSAPEAPIYSMKITGLVQHEESANRMPYVPEKLIGEIAVRPPLDAYEGFKETVLGTYTDYVDVKGVIKTSDCTVFIAESSNQDIRSREADINCIGERIVRLANHPEEALQMMKEAPFPNPSDEWSDINGF